MLYNTCTLINENRNICHDLQYTQDTACWDGHIKKKPNDSIAQKMHVKVDNWKGGWMGGWVEAKARLRIAYSNQKVLAYLKSGLSFILFLYWVE